MVEGPGCKVKGEKLKPRIKGQTVEAVAGDAVDKFLKRRKQDKNSDVYSPFHDLLGKECTDVKTLGKELFIFFKDYHQCLRLHFLMAGGFRLNGENIDVDGGEGNTSTLVLTLSKDTVKFNKSAVELRSTHTTKERIRNLLSLDICANEFSPRRAVITILEQRGRQICDVLLDQAILPGVGNIIKNEALFDSGIRPSTTVEELTEKHIWYLVKMTRDFSLIFYKCRKENRALQPYLKVYRRAVCKDCGGKVTNTRVGDDSERLTSYCSVCQTNDINVLQNRKIPTKNSLLGWVRSGVDENTTQEQWSCSQCTLLNDFNRSNCSICHSPRTSLKTNAASKLEECGAGTSFPVKRRATSPPALNSPPNKMTKTSVGPLSRTKLTNTRLNSDSGGVQQMSGSIKGTKDERDIGRKASIEIPKCPEHKFPCTMREVRKKNHNAGRMFWSCSYGRNCNFFMWADNMFPVCEGHGKICAIRTVLKEGPNNGRRFFACSQNKKKQCQFFKWADEYHAVTIR